MWRTPQDPLDPPPVDFDSVVIHARGDNDFREIELQLDSPLLNWVIEQYSGPRRVPVQRLLKVTSEEKDDGTVEVQDALAAERASITLPKARPPSRGS